MPQVLTADLELDCKYLLCPMPILKLSQAIKNIQVGETIRVETTDPGSWYDIPLWTRRTGHELLCTEQESGSFRFLIRRGK